MNYKMFYNHLTMFIVMFIIGITLNPMNILIYDIQHIYVSTTLIYSGLLMASNMIWAHEIIHYINYNTFNIVIFTFGLLLSFIFIILLRYQIYIDDKNWLKRMITHHSTALTTSEQILYKTENDNVKELAHDIINAQEREIKLMKQLL